MASMAMLILCIAWIFTALYALHIEKIQQLKFNQLADEFILKYKGVLKRGNRSKKRRR